MNVAAILKGKENHKKTGEGLVPLTCGNLESYFKGQIHVMRLTERRK